ncbi:hypothetical protein [Aquibacillus salsiterrae]|uniref:Uncharacterized protein n=1 Tax=Aquibacillus salsiterrae TaxID=2950439 RepID=A0A9X3WEB1_9BACI|nr:hypothetical protein [Aquibacillus salsiterrae]MDC3418152.1 hypothetical protein [Aquibacillus salsiterrae]
MDVGKEEALMEAVIVIVLAIVVLVSILSPFFSKQFEHDETADKVEDGQEKEQIFSHLADLEYDFEMGKLSEQDYVQTKAELTAKAKPFIRPSDTKQEKIEKKVDHEIESYLNKNGLLVNKGGTSNG